MRLALLIVAAVAALLVACGEEPPSATEARPLATQPIRANSHSIRYPDPREGFRPNWRTSVGAGTTAGRRFRKRTRLQQLRHCPPPSLHCLRHRPLPSRPRSSHGPLLPPHRLPYRLRSQPRRRPQLLGPSHLWVRRFLRLLQLLQHQQLRLPHPHACKRLLLHVRRRFQARNWLLPGCR